MKNSDIFNVQIIFFRHRLRLRLNNGPWEKGIVASRRKIQRGQTQGPGGPTSGAWGGVVTMEMGCDR